MGERARVVTFNLIFYAFTVVMAVTIMASCYVAKASTVRYLIGWWARRVQWLVRNILGGRIEVRGAERLPPRPYIIAPKHQSELDVVVIFERHTDCTAVAMKELADLPFIGPICRKLELIIVSVEGGPQGKTAETRAGAKLAAERGQTILIYPEGELMSLGAKERYRSGVWHIQEATGLPVVPIAQSLGAIWPRREWSKRVGATGAIEYLEPIPPGLEKDELLARLEREIETASMALIREHAHPGDLTRAEDRFARGARNED